jgi:hypothetical protein
MVISASGISDAYWGDPDLVPGIIVQRSKKERIQDAAIGALILACFVAAAAISVLQFPIPLRDTPFVLHGLDLPEKTIYCPGEVYSYASDVEITEPGIFTLHVGIMQADTKKYINSTLAEMPPVPRSEAARIIQPVYFEIPDLPPGDYIRVAGIDADHVDSIPIFVEVPFTIREGCDENE